MTKLLISFVLCAPFLVASAALGDTLASMRQRGTLRWGADREGGGPYVFPSNDDPRQIQGFEVDLAELLSKRLGLTAEFCQGQWDKLPEVLNRGDIDIVLNGYEWTATRGKRFGCSIPYYLYELQFMVRADDPRFTTVDSFRATEGGEKIRVGVLGGSAAQTYLVENYPKSVEIVSFDGNTDAMRAVELAADDIDATLQDLPIVTFYEDGFPALRRLAEPVGLGYYVALTRYEDTELLKAINQAIIDCLRDGSLRQVYQRYGLWNPAQWQRGLETDINGHAIGFNLDTVDAIEQDNERFAADRGWGVVVQRGPLLIAAAWMTVKLSIVAMPLAILIGLIAALGRMYGPRPLASLMHFYIEVVRGTPLVLQLYVIFFLLPEIGLSIQAFWAAIIGLAINYSAYEAEIYRAGLQAIPRGQMEAALSLGMSRWLALRRVIVPQATRIVIPPMTNDFIALFKDTAVCSVITVVELSKEYYIHARSTGAIVELGIVTAVLYLAMSFPLTLLAGNLEKRLARSH